MCAHIESPVQHWMKTATRCLQQFNRSARRKSGTQLVLQKSSGYQSCHRMLNPLYDGLSGAKSIRPQLVERSMSLAAFDRSYEFEETMPLPQDIRPVFQDIQDTLVRSDAPW